MLLSADTFSNTSRSQNLLYRVVQKKTNKLHYTILMQLFNIKLNIIFHQNACGVQGNKD